MQVQHPQARPLKNRLRASKAIILMLSALGLSQCTLAATIQYHCSYTQASYTAAFAKEPQMKSCPEGRCNLKLLIEGSSASINNVTGFKVSQSDAWIKLSRQAKDPIMGGLDTTELTINTADMSFTSIKTSTPSVILTTQGRCQ